MNIYFAWTMRWAHSPKSLYSHIGEHLKTHGQVLAEHVAHAYQNQELYNVTFTNKDIFEADVEFMDKADVVVAEVSLSSHSVWWELCYAQHVRNVPILALYRTWADVSVSLQWNEYINLQEYNGEEQLKVIIDDFIASLTVE